MRFALLIFILAQSFTVLAQQSNDSLLNRIIVIGGLQKGAAGPQLLLHAIQEKVPLDAKTTLLFVGDNDAQQVRRLANLVKDSHASFVFLPGEQEWNQGRKFGLDSVLKLEAFIKDVAGKNIQFLPKCGCPDRKKSSSARMWY